MNDKDRTLKAIGGYLTTAYPELYIKYYPAAYVKMRRTGAHWVSFEYDERNNLVIKNTESSFWEFIKSIRIGYFIISDYQNSEFIDTVLSKVNKMLSNIDSYDYYISLFESEYPKHKALSRMNSRRCIIITLITLIALVAGCCTLKDSSYHYDTESEYEISNEGGFNYVTDKTGNHVLPYGFSSASTGSNKSFVAECNGEIVIMDYQGNIIHHINNSDKYRLNYAFPLNEKVWGYAVTIIDGDKSERIGKGLVINDSIVTPPIYSDITKVSENSFRVHFNDGKTEIYDNNGHLCAYSTFMDTNKLNKSDIAFPYLIISVIVYLSFSGYRIYRRRKGTMF